MTDSEYERLTTVASAEGNSMTMDVSAACSRSSLVRPETQHCFFRSQRVPYCVDSRLSASLKNLRPILSSNLFDCIENPI
jgi:hypothetical protein